MKTATQQITSLLHEVTDSNELLKIANLAHNAIKQLAQTIKYDLSIGQKVKISAGPNNLDETGEIIKINRTRAVCKIDGRMQNYNVPFSMLTII
jgi:transcription antitermination factor NusG